MDSPDQCAWQVGLQVTSSQNLSQQKFLDPFGESACSHHIAHPFPSNSRSGWMCTLLPDSARVHSRVTVAWGEFYLRILPPRTAIAGGLFHLKKDPRTIPPHRPPPHSFAIVQHQARNYPTALGLLRQRGRPAPPASGDEEASDLITPGANDNWAP
jgi:hypothetical protein